MSTMDRMEIVPYAAADSPDAIALEATLDQGEAIALRFRRPTFHARSSVYEKSVILCAKSDGRLVGIAAGTLKNVGLNGVVRRAIYGYDLRVDPAFRRGGTAQRLGNAVIESLGGGECRYSLVAGQNRLAVRFTQRAFGAACTIPLVYVIIPVMRSRRRRPACVDPGPEEIHTGVPAARRTARHAPSLPLRIFWPAMSGRSASKEDRPAARSGQTNRCLRRRLSVSPVICSSLDSWLVRWQTLGSSPASPGRARWCEAGFCTICSHVEFRRRVSC